MNKPVTETDWVGKWYELTRDRGENHLMIFGKIDLNANEVEWFEMSHSRMDGAGALTTLLRAEGYPIDRVPEGRPGKPPSGLMKLWAFFRFFRSSSHAQVSWLKGDPEARNLDIHDMAWAVLSADETSRIHELARERGVSINSYLLHHLNRIVWDGLEFEVQGSARWAFPVNLRGELRREDPCSNHSTAIFLSAGRDTSPEQFHAQIKSQLKAGLHWVNWWIHEIGKWVGVRGMRFISKRYSQKRFWLGSFSNLGKWPLEAQGGEVAWIAATPGSRTFPVGFACLEWNGRLTWTLRVHPFACPDRERAGALLKRLRAEAAGDASGSRIAFPNGSKELSYAHEEEQQRPQRGRS